MGLAAFFLAVLCVTSLLAVATESSVVERSKIEQHFSNKTIQTIKVEVEAVQCRVKPGRFADLVLVRKDFDQDGSTYHPRRWDLNVHSLRHSMRDRLRAVQCPPDMIDQIGGWTTAGIGQRYGSGYALEALKTALGLL